MKTNTTMHRDKLFTTRTYNGAITTGFIVYHR